MMNLMVATIAGVVLLVLVPLVVFANDPIEAKKTVLCSDLKTVIASISDPEHGEIPTWSGMEGKTNLLLVTNPKTKTWTLIQYDDKIACIIGLGTKSTLIPLGPPI